MLQYCQLLVRHSQMYNPVDILGHCSWILVPVPSTAYIAGGIDGFCGEPELTESFQLVQPAEPSADDQRINIVRSHVIYRVI